MTAEQFLNRRKPNVQVDHLFVSAMTMDYPAVKKIIQKWNSLPNSDASIKVLGGPIACGYRKVLATLKFDLAIIGEAEKPLSELISCDFFQGNLNPDILSKIGGIVYSGLSFISSLPDIH
jgi:radical SAM superfamily enzyme YgiQ (UPF0313 family)